mmetsp:Transcript_5008/g.7670  ORF Transcript_5008/g.7670 Transcript_5008/m.7670 type:complete len:112 (-) Transcript_5008:1514-1849(-)
MVKTSRERKKIEAMNTNTNGEIKVPSRNTATSTDSLNEKMRANTNINSKNTLHSIDGDRIFLFKRYCTAFVVATCSRFLVDKIRNACMIPGKSATASKVSRRILVKSSISD